MLTFVDDMMTMAQTNEEMIEILDKAFQILRVNNLKLNLKKCKLGFKEVTWLGFSISKDGVRPEMSKIEKCRQLQPPTSVKEIQSQKKLKDQIESLMIFLIGLIYFHFIGPIVIVMICRCHASRKA